MINYLIISCLLYFHIIIMKFFIKINLKIYNNSKISILNIFIFIILKKGYEE